MRLALLQTRAILTIGLFALITFILAFLPSLPIGEESLTYLPSIFRIGVGVDQGVKVDGAMGLGVDGSMGSRVGVGAENDVRQLRIGIVEQTSFHDEVIGGVLAVLHHLNLNYTIYRDRMYSGFEHVLTDLQPVLAPLKQFEPAVTAGEIDVAVLVTCDAGFWNHHQSLLDTLYSSSSTHTICIPHEIEKFNHMANRGHITPLAKVDRLTMMTLATHASERIREMFVEWTGSGEWKGWNRVSVAEFAPVFYLPDDIRESKSDKQGVLSSAAILGRLIPGARRYEVIFAELLDALIADPAAWGYRMIQRPPPNDPSRARFEPIDEQDAFKLHLIGKPVDIPLEIPKALYAKDEDGEVGENVVVLHTDAEYPEFYRLIASVDLILPAFGGRKYLDQRASASIPAAIIGQTPLFGTDGMLTAYPYLSSPAITLHSPHLSEIEAIAQMRKGLDPLTGDSPRIVPDRFTSDWDGYERGLRKENGRVWKRVLESVVEKRREKVRYTKYW